MEDHIDPNHVIDEDPPEIYAPKPVDTSAEKPPTQRLVLNPDNFKFYGEDQ